MLSKRDLNSLFFRFPLAIFEAAGTGTEGLGGSAKGIPHCVYRSTIGDAILGFQQLLGTKKRKEKEMAKNSIRENKNAAWFSNQENVRTHFFGRTLTIHSRPSWPPCLHYVPITRRRRWGGMNDDEAYNQRSEQKDEKTSSLALSHSHSLRGQPGPVFTYFCHKTLEIMVLFPLITKLLRGEP